MAAQSCADHTAGRPRASGSAYICMINRHMEDAIQTGVPRRTVASKIGYKFYFYLYNPVLVKQVREVCIGRNRYDSLKS